MSKPSLRELLDELRGLVTDQDLAGARQVRIWIDVDSETGGVWEAEVDVKRGVSGARKASRRRSRIGETTE